MIEGTNIRRILVRLLNVLILLVVLGTKSEAQLNFINAADSLGVNYNYGLGTVWHGAAFGGGVSFFDFNKDGWDDLTFSTNSGDSIYFYENNSGTFKKITSLVPFKAETKQIIWVDIDNDGDYDLFITSVDRGNRLYENTGSLIMRDITLPSSIGTTNHRTIGACWGDYNRDGYLDLYLSNYLLNSSSSNILYRNNGDNTFTDVSKSTEVYDTSTFSMASAFLDYDKDGWPDIYTTSDFANQPNLLFKNNGNSTFTDVTAASNTNPGMDAMCATIEDYNNDSLLDIYITNTPFPGNVLLHNLGNGKFKDTARSVGVEMNAWAWGSCFLDAENDGDMDLYVSSSSKLSINSAYFNNNGLGGFTKPTGIGFLGDSVQSYGNAVGDFNNDGLADIAVANQQAKAFLWTNKGSGGNYIKIGLTGYLTNKNGVGSFIYVYSSNGIQMKYTMCGEGLAGQNSQYEIFGLDTTSIIDSIEINWLSGHKEKLYNVSVNQTINIKEGAIKPLTATILADDSLISGKLIKICKGDSVVLSPQINFDHVSWSTGDTTPTLKIGDSGVYVMTVSIGNGPVSVDSIEVRVIDFSNFSIGPPDTSFCPGGVLKSNISADRYKWNDGSTSNSKTIYSSGKYWLRISEFSCSATDQINVTVYKVDKMTLGNDTLICKGQSLILNPGNQWVSYLWSDNSTGKTLAVTDSGEYRVIVTDGNACSRYDKILVNTTICTGVELPESQTTIQIYPNPAKDVLVILNSSGDEWNYRFINSGGQQVISGELTDKIEIDVSEIPSGLYTVYFFNKKSGDIPAIKKVLIVR